MARPRFADELVLRSARGRWVLAATIPGSGMAALDATVVNIALPRIGTDLGVGLTGLQWTVIAYTLTLAAFLLLGGSLLVAQGPGHGGEARRPLRRGADRAGDWASAGRPGCTEES